MITPTVVNQDAIQPFIDMVTSGYFDDHEGYVITVSDSSGMGYGARDAENAWPTRFAKRLKAIGGKDGGTLIRPIANNPNWDLTTTLGQFSKGANPYGFTDTLASHPAYATTDWDGWQVTGGLGGFFITHVEDTGVAKATTWTAGAGIRRYMTPYADAALADSEKRRFVFVSAQSAASAPASMSSASVGDEILDGDVYWYCDGLEAGTEAARADSTVYAYLAVVKEGGRKFRALGGKTGATEATWTKAIGGQTTETGLTTVWQNVGFVYKQVMLPAFRTVDVIYSEHTGTNVDTLGFAEYEGGFSATLTSTASATAWGKKLNLAPASGDLSVRTLMIKHSAGTTYYEGFLTHKYADRSGLHDFNLSIAGLGLDKIVAKATTTALQNAWVGKDVIPAGCPVLVVFQIGRNDWSRSVALGTTQASTAAIIAWFKAAFGDNVYFLWVQPWPGNGQGVPTVADAGYNYHVGQRNTAEANGCASVDLSMIHGGVSGATALTYKFLCPDGIHPSDAGAVLAAEGIIAGLGLPDTDTPSGTLTSVDLTNIQASCAAALTAAGVTTIAADAAKTRKYLTNKLTQPADGIGVQTVFEDDAVTVLEQATLTNDGGTRTRNPL